jgi:hypothetical protein
MDLLRIVFFVYSSATRLPRSVEQTGRQRPLPANGTQWRLCAVRQYLAKSWRPIERHEALAVRVGTRDRSRQRSPLATWNDHLQTCRGAFKFCHNELMGELKRTPVYRWRVWATA